MEKITIIQNGFIQNPDSQKIKANIVLKKNKIIDIFESNECGLAKNIKNIDYIDAEGLTITPGLIDQHIHGGYGIDFNFANADEIIELTAKLTKHGITAFVATVMTDSEENIQRQIKEICTAMKKQPENSSKILGIHLEGPFINPEYKGIHPDNLILKPNINNFKKFECDEIKIVSYAPELDKNLELTKYLAKKNIIPSVGHSKATHEELKSALKAGLRQVTHLFNAMPSLHHRNPGILGEALVNDDIYTEVIADNQHLHPLIIDLIIKTKLKSRIIFISDSLPLNRNYREYIMFGGQRIYRKNNKAVSDNGVFAGSLSFLDDNLRKNINKISFSDFLTFASLNPAKNLGLNSKGLIKTGYDADLVLWDENFHVRKTFIKGIIL